MLTTTLRITFAPLLLLAAAAAQEPKSAEAPAPALPPPLALGAPLPGDALLFDLDGEPRALSDLARPVTVVCFYGAGSARQRERDAELAALEARFADADPAVSFVHVASNASDIGLVPQRAAPGKPAYGRLRRHLEERELAFTLHADHKNALADRLGARTTPELFVFAGDAGLVYRGALLPARVTALLDALVAGRDVEPAATEPAGDPIRRAPNSAPDGRHSLFVDDPDAAVAAAVRDKKLLVYSFSGFNCASCRIMEDNVFPMPEVMTWMRPHFVEARVHTDTQNTLTAERFASNRELQEQLAKTRANPSYVVVDPATSKVLGRFTLSGGFRAWSGKWATFLRRTLREPR